MNNPASISANDLGPFIEEAERRRYPRPSLSRPLSVKPPHNSEEVVANPLTKLRVKT